jgi:ankyrin repeat protein
MPSNTLANAKLSHAFFASMGHPDLEDDATPLMLAFDCGKSFPEDTQKMAAILIESGADVNQATKNGNTILHMAVKENAHQWVKFLMKCGADLEAKNEAGKKPIDLSTCEEMTKTIISLKNAIEQAEQVETMKPSSPRR